MKVNIIPIITVVENHPIRPKIVQITTSMVCPKTKAVLNMTRGVILVVESFFLPKR